MHILHLLPRSLIHAKFLYLHDFFAGKSISLGWLQEKNVTKTGKVFLFLKGFELF